MLVRSDLSKEYSASVMNGLRKGISQEWILAQRIVDMYFTKLVLVELD